MARSTLRSLAAVLGAVALSPARGFLEDVALVQGRVQVGLGPVKASDDEISQASERAQAAAAERALAAKRAAAEKAAAESMVNSTDRSKAAERAEALGTEGMDAATRQVKVAKQQLQQARKKISEYRARLRELSKENEVAQQKLNRSITKGKMFREKSVHAKLKEEERANMKGKHVHLDMKKYAERIKTGNLDSYGLWTWDNSKPHFWEKTWDTLSNHIFGLDKLAKSVFNRTEYDSQSRKYAKYEKFFSAKIAAADQETKEVTALLQEATRQTEEAEAVIAGAAEAKEASAAQRKKAREELARLKAERRRDDAREEAADAAMKAETRAAEQDGEEGGSELTK